MNLGITFLRIVSYMKNCTGLNLGEGLCISHFPDSRLYLLNGFDFDLFSTAWHWKPAIVFLSLLPSKNPQLTSHVLDIAFFSIREIIFLSLVTAERLFTNLIVEIRGKIYHLKINWPVRLKLCCTMSHSPKKTKRVTRSGLWPPGK